MYQDMKRQYWWKGIKRDMFFFFFFCGKVYDLSAGESKAPKTIGVTPTIRGIKVEVG